LLFPSLLALLSCGGKADDPAATGGAGGAAGGGGAGGGAGTAIASGLPCGVERVLRERCQECHGEKPAFGAPSPLVTYDDLNQKAVTEPSRDIYTVMQERLRSATKPMPPPSRPRLTVEELAVIDAWLDEGLPRSTDVACPAPEPKENKPPPSCDPTIRLKPKTPWKMPKNEVDRYVCYGVDLEGTPGKRHITGIVPFIDNETIVHHLLLFTMSEAEPADPHPCSDLFPIEGKAIYAWAPGGPPYLLPEAAGFPVKAEEKTHLMVQVHYSNLKQLDGQEDATELGLCMTDKPRPYDADIMWVGGYDFKLPPHQTSTVECTLSFLGGATQFLPIHVFQAWPHMHQLGLRLESELIQPSGSKVSLGLADPYSFYDQVVYPMDVTIYPGDKIATRCTWNNTTSSTVKWGEATNEEMCFNLLAYYPRIALPQYGSPAAAALSPCKMLP
jgi:mono/diheme cytochrome c family protein